MRSLQRDPDTHLGRPLASTSSTPNGFCVVWTRGEFSKPPIAGHLKTLEAFLKPRFPVYALGWKWFAAHAQRVRDAYGGTLRLLISDALAREDFAIVGDRAAELLEHDPCNEFGCEAALTAAHRRSDSSAALALFRRYEAAVRRELGTEPPERLRRLLRATLRAQSTALRVV